MLRDAGLTPDAILAFIRERIDSAGATAPAGYALSRAVSPEAAPRLSGIQSK
jgi:hypothetical protein